MSYLPQVVGARHISGFIVSTRFDDGTEKYIDVSQWFKGPVFEPLKERKLFKKFFIEGGTLAWPNGVDIAPEALYAAADAKKRHKKKDGADTENTPLILSVRPTADGRANGDRGFALRVGPPAAAEPAARSDGPPARSSAANSVRPVRPQYRAMDSESWAADFFHLALAPEEITELAGSPTKVEAPTVLNFLEEVIRIVLKRLERADIPAKYDAREIEGDDYEKWILLNNTSLSQQGTGQQPNPIKD